MDSVWGVCSHDAAGLPRAAESTRARCPGLTGAGIGASHQTGWTGLVAKMLQMFGSTTATEILTEGTRAATAYEEAGG